MDLKIKDKLICIVKSHKIFAPDEIVEIEHVASSGGDSYYKLKGYSDWLNDTEIKMYFKAY